MEHNQSGIVPRGRYFGHGELRVVVLMLLAQGPGHGYELIKSIEALTHGLYVPSPGVIYPALDKLKQQGLIDALADDKTAQRPYAVTAAGKQWLAANQPQVAQIEAHIHARSVGYALRRDPQMQRALDNLKTTLDIRINQQQATPEQLRAIVRLLDDTAAAIAQLV